LHEQKTLKADERTQGRNHRHNRGIGGHGARPGLPALAHLSDRKPVLQKEEIGGANAEHDEGMAVETVANPSPA
jgi:hypothetical protein